MINIGEGGVPALWNSSPKRYIWGEISNQPEVGFFFPCEQFMALPYSPNKVNKMDC